MAIARAALDVKFSAKETGSNDFGAGGVFEPELRQLLQWTSGTGAGQADLLFVDQRTVASASNDDLDLAGVLSSAFGATLTMVELAALLVINAPRTGAANTTDLTIGGGSNPVVGFLGGTTPTIGPLKPGAMLALGSTNAAGLGAVTASTGDLLRIANSSGASATYQIAILGRSA